MYKRQGVTIVRKPLKNKKALTLLYNTLAVISQKNPAAFEKPVNFETYLYKCRSLPGTYHFVNLKN